MSGTACHITDCRRIQGKTDGKDNRTGNDVREQFPDLLYKDRENDCDNTANNLRPHNRANAKLTADGSQSRYVSKTGTHDNRKCRTNFMEQRKQLQKCRQRGENKRCLDHHGLLLIGQTAYPCDDHGRCDNTDDCCQNVL